MRIIKRVFNRKGPVRRPENVVWADRKRKPGKKIFKMNNMPKAG